MSLHAGIETLDFRFDGQHAVASFAPVLVGVVGSSLGYWIAGMLSINDMGATPAVVSLRLDQAVAELGPGATP